MVIFKKIYQYTPKRTKLHHLKNIWGSMPSNPLINAHGEAA